MGALVVAAAAAVAAAAVTAGWGWIAVPLAVVAAAAAVPVAGNSCLDQVLPWGLNKQAAQSWLFHQHSGRETLPVNNDQPLSDCF